MFIILKYEEEKDQETKVAFFPLRLFVYDDNLKSLTLESRLLTKKNKHYFPLSLLTHICNDEQKNKIKVQFRNVLFDF